VTARLARLYPALAYDPAPDPGNFWQTTVPELPAPPPLEGDAATEVAVVGAGYTGLNAALRLAGHGIGATVLDAAWPGWGASGRNGGFCCLGGTKRSASSLIADFGAAEAGRFFAAQVAAVEHVREMLVEHGIDAEACGDGEYILAHRPKDFAAMPAEAAAFTAKYGRPATVLSAAELAGRGLESPALHGGMHIGVGFGLNPLKYALGLTKAGTAQGVVLHGNSPVTRIAREGAGFRLVTPRGSLRAGKLVVATNGYSSEGVPEWLGGRYLPVLSNILVSRVLTRDELAAQNWTQVALCADTRNLLHYFRLLRDGRMLFGMRGGTGASAGETEGMQRRIRADFEAFFPAWRGVETPHFWSGLACLGRDLVAYVGPVPGMDGAYLSLAYHGNGVAMGSWCGARLGDLVADRIGLVDIPRVLTRPLRRYPLAPLRRQYLKGAYAWFGVVDR
jgi:glycine/D-amino acid oxidase-like deaminating enzyme